MGRGCGRLGRGGGLALPEPDHCRSETWIPESRNRISRVRRDAAAAAQGPDHRGPPPGFEARSPGPPGTAADGGSRPRDPVQLARAAHRRRALPRSLRRQRGARARGDFRGRPARSWSSAIRRWPRPCAARSRDSAPPGPRSAAPTRSPSSQVQPLRSTWSSSIRPSMPTCGRGSPRGSPRAVGWRRGRWCTSSGRPIASRPCRRRFDSIAKVVPARCGTRSMSSTRQPAIRSRRGRRRPGGPGPGTGRPR